MPFSSSQSASDAGNRNRILIIEDSPDNLRLLVQLLRARGYHLSIARDGHDGYQRATINPPDLILLDVYMPKADGFATCRLLKTDKRTRRIPVIFLTAANDAEARLKGFALGAVDYICKPFVADEVLARVNIHLNLAHHLRKAPASQQFDTTTTIPAHINSDEILVNAAKDLLTMNLATPLSMADLVNQLGTNERWLNKIFRQYTKTTVFAWMREERLRQARQLLTETSLDIATIAEQLGYHSQSHFSNSFHEHTGVSPRDYRAARNKN